MSVLLFTCLAVLGIAVAVTVMACIAELLNALDIFIALKRMKKVPRPQTRWYC